jgi:hypothetical protein
VQLKQLGHCNLIAFFGFAFSALKFVSYEGKKLETFQIEIKPFYFTPNVNFPSPYMLRNHKKGFLCKIISIINRLKLLYDSESFVVRREKKAGDILHDLLSTSPDLARHSFSLSFRTFFPSSLLSDTHNTYSIFHPTL